jgi:hypothetical protein
MRQGPDELGILARLIASKHVIQMGNMNAGTGSRARMGTYFCSDLTRDLYGILAGPWAPTPKLRPQSRKDVE